MKIQQIQEKNSAHSTYYIKAMTAYLAKGMSAVEPYYFFVCVSIFCIHTVLKTREKVECQLTDC